MVKRFFKGIRRSRAERQIPVPHFKREEISVRRIPLHGKVEKVCLTLPKFGRTAFKLFPGYVDIGSIRVFQEYRGTQVGSALMQRIEEIARREGKHFILTAAAKVLPSEEHPYGFYKKLGFELDVGQQEKGIKARVRKGERILMVKYLTKEGRRLREEMLAK